MQVYLVFVDFQFGDKNSMIFLVLSMGDTKVYHFFEAHHKQLSCYLVHPASKSSMTIRRCFQHAVQYLIKSKNTD